MRVTFDIDDDLMRRLREEAARRDSTMSALVEAGLRRILDEPPARTRIDGDLPPLPTRNAGVPRVDVADRDALEAAMGDEEPPGPV
ncbi:MAG: ribbon-helix-helix protein, CopG family [Chloroflexi bacterium]|nr:ribbon-helix-helix protein, CopG family [Chloroflexota bacterium]